MAAWCALMCHKNRVRKITRLFIEVSSQGRSLICKNKRLRRMNTALHKFDALLARRTSNLTGTKKIHTDDVAQQRSMKCFWLARACAWKTTNWRCYIHKATYTKLRHQYGIFRDQSPRLLLRFRDRSLAVYRPVLQSPNSFQRSISRIFHVLSVEDVLRNYGSTSAV